MKIAIASDHRGVDTKNQIIEYLKSLNYEVVDCSIKNDPEDDYPDFAFKVGNAINNGESDLGILICRTGIGMSIAANKIKNIRCAKIDSVEEAILCRNDNGANIITFSYSKTIDEIKQMIDAFLASKELNSERHIRRINKIIKYENGEYNEL